MGMKTEEKRILVITGDAGFGHRSAAEAVQAAFEGAYGDQCEVILKNPLDHADAPQFLQKSASDYDEIIETEPGLYRFAYDLSDAALPVALMEGGLVLFLLKAFRQMVLDLMPNLIITTYPIFQAPLTAAIDLEGLDLPVMTVVTDLVTVHHVWFHDKVTRITVPTDTVRGLALESGLTDEQVIETGIPVDPQIAALKDISVSELREKMGWEADPTCLLVVGSPRVFELMEIMHALDEVDADLQFILVAGGNDALYEDFMAATWRHPARVYNFVETLPEMMRAADLVLCKAGGLITTESLASGLPMMIVNFLPGQEEGNVDYVVSHGAGALCDTPGNAVETLNVWLEGDGVRLQQFAENAARAGRAKAAQKIAGEAWKLVTERS